MRPLPLKQEYGPTLAQLIAPKWQSMRWTGRSLALALACALIAAIAAVALRFAPPVYSSSDPVPFSFSYKGLYRVSPEAGWLVSVARPRSGKLQDSFAVRPLRLPSYSGSVTAELPLYATGYEQSLARHFGAGFRTDGEGVPEIAATDVYTGYQVFYRVRIDGQLLYGRDVMLLPAQPHARDGVVIRMLSAPESATSLTSPTLVGSEGILEGVLASFAFG